jgi:hypothetical protein
MAAILFVKKKINEGLLLAGLGNTALHSLSFLTPAWPSASDSQ